MGRSLISGSLVLVALALAVPAAAEARTPCPAAEAAATAANGAAVSDAIFCLTNQIRASYGLAAFRRDARLDAAARLHSEDMAARDYFAHDTPEGLDPSARAVAQGYTFGVGENIAAGYRDARTAIVAWMASPGHCRNILGVARDIGVGTAATPGSNYTQDFGNYDFGASNAAAAGCAYHVDLDALVQQDPAAPIAAGTAATTSAPGGTRSPASDAAPAGAPALGSLGLSRTRLRARGGGTLVSYTLSEPATVTFHVQRAAGRGRWQSLGAGIARAGGRGRNSFRLHARLRGRPLSRGSYRLVAIASDAAGDESPPRRARFRVVRG
jgi:uncharacterized protein YkwD